MITYFQDKVVWLTGASSGIGEATAYALAHEGARLVLSARRAAELERVAEACSLPSDKIMVLPFDVTDLEAMPELTRQVIDRFGHIDMLINNAGISQRSHALDTELSVDRQLLEVNYMGVVALTKAVLPDMIARQSGQIITVASMAGIVATPKRSSYAAAKSAIIGFMDALRAEIHQHNIHIGVVCPGYVHTDLSIHALMGDGSPQGTMDRATARGIAPDDFARKMLRAIANKRDQVNIGGAKEKLAVFLYHFFPSLLRKVVRRIPAT